MLVGALGCVGVGCVGVVVVDFEAVDSALELKLSTLRWSCRRLRNWFCKIRRWIFWCWSYCLG